MKYVITGIITTRTPLHVSEPGDNCIALDGHVAFWKTPGHFPLTRTRRQPYSRTGFPLAPVAPEDADKNQQSPLQREAWVDVPVVPANSLRGRIRRAAARIFCDTLIKNGESLSVAAYNVMQCGAATGKPTGSPMPFDEIIEGQEHAYFGLLGGGTRMRRSNLRVFDLVAITPVTAPYLGVDDESMINPAGRLTSFLFKRRNDDLMALSDPEHQKKILGTNAVEAINDYQDKQAENRARSKTDREGGAAEADGQNDAGEVTRGLNGFSAVEVVNPGVHFRVRFEVDGKEEHAGLLLTCLPKVLGRMGGLGQIGFGDMGVVSMRIQEGEKPAEDVFKPGTLVLADEKDSVVRRVTKASAAAVEKATAAEIEKLALGAADKVTKASAGKATAAEEGGA